MLRDETIARVVKFRDERNWRQFHTPKDLAISMSLEAAELLELFQWSGTDLECRDKLPQLREELADVLSYCILLADVCGLDLDEIMNERSRKTKPSTRWKRPGAVPPSIRSFPSEAAAPASLLTECVGLRSSGSRSSK